ncbi:MAG: hypothetical protein M4579_005212 [Chaenotheca gracillima]|nr:MAG: hypothetical protein M4579_005212 [Chaenotheca gracillima]
MSATLDDRQDLREEAESGVESADFDKNGAHMQSFLLHIRGDSIDSEQAHFTRKRLTFPEMLVEMEKTARVKESQDVSCKSSLKDNENHMLQDEFEDSKAAVIDGGFRAWATVFAAHLTIFSVGGWNGAFGVFQNYYSAELLRGTSPAAISWIGSFQLFFMLFLGTLTGRLFDAGHWRLTFSGGSACLVLFTFLTSFCEKWWAILLLQGILSGLSMGMVLCTTTMILRTYFTKKLAVAIGLGASGSCTGGIIFTILAGQLLPRIGYHWTMRAITLVMLCLLVPVNVFIRLGPNVKKVSAPLIDRTAFRDLPYLLTMLGLFFCFWGVYFGFYYIVSYGVDILGLDQDKATLLLIYLNLANFFGRILPNLMSDRWLGPLNTLIPAMAISSAVLFAWIAASTSTSLIVIVCLYGLASGSLQSLFSAATLSFVPDMSCAGVRLGMVFTAVSFGGLTGAPVGGWLIQARGGGYLYAQIFAGGTIAVGTVLLIVARVLKRGWGAAKL